jgi:hypothetical protein
MNGKGQVTHMVKINLLSLKQNIATILCFPEGRKENQFTMVIDVQNQAIINNSLNKKGNAYAIHAAWKMYDEFLKTGTLPESATAIWC